MRSAAAALIVFYLSALSIPGTEGILSGRYEYNGKLSKEELRISYVISSKKVVITFSCGSKKKSTYKFSYLEQGDNAGKLNLDKEYEEYLDLFDDFQDKCPKWGEDAEVGDLATFSSTKKGIEILLNPYRLELTYV